MALALSPAGCATKRGLVETAATTTTLGGVNRLLRGRIVRLHFQGGTVEAKARDVRVWPERVEWVTFSTLQPRSRPVADLDSVTANTRGSTVLRGAGLGLLAGLGAGLLGGGVVARGETGPYAGLGGAFVALGFAGAGLVLGTASGLSGGKRRATVTLYEGPVTRYTPER